MDRRHFLQSLLGVSAAAGCATMGRPAPPRKGPNVAALHAEPLDKVRVGVIGLGMRGRGAVHRLLRVEGVEIRALCDIEPEKVAHARKSVTDAGRPAPAEYGTAGPDHWRDLCERDDVDLVYSCTPWDLHAPNAVHAMRHGKHAAIEVPAAVTLDECFQLVETSEATQRHCMMLENCCYDFFELATLNMVRQGVLGEVLHAEGAYIHDLRTLKFSLRGYHERWRLMHSITRNGNLYPTHGLGPVAQCLNINRGDRMTALSSMSTREAGLSRYARGNYEPGSWERRQDYRLGDMNTTIIRTELGRTIMLQHDTTSPRPYSRIHLLSGTGGIVRKWPEPRIALEPSTHGWQSPEQEAETLARFEHPLAARMGAKAREVGGHGGMDFMMDWRLIECLRRGEPLDQNVYDAAAWSCIGPLSEASVEAGGGLVEVPDFTRGDWRTIPPLGIVT